MNDTCYSASAEFLSVDQAIAFLLDHANPIEGIENAPVEKAIGRVLVQDLTSSIDVPGFDNSAMDGYAVASRDINPSGTTSLPVSSRIIAGDAGEPLPKGRAARIFTGAPLPPGADAVVMQEYCRESEGSVIIPGPVEAGQNVRCRGEDIAAGTVILKKGIRLRPQELGLAASVGLAELPVYPRLRVALLSTGNELARPGSSLRKGQIYNSNHYSLTGLLEALGCVIRDFGIVPDDAEKTRNVLERASREADVIITSGGVSVGEEDHVKAALGELGHINFWKIAVKPGKPLAFGAVDKTPLIGLPGNPVSAFVTFCLFARPFLLRTQGIQDVAPLSYGVVADFDWPKPDKRREFLRARLEASGDGFSRAVIHPKQGSGVLTSTVWAHGFVEIAPKTPVKRGEIVRFIPFSGLLS